MATEDLKGCKFGQVVSGLNSRSKGCGFQLCLVLSKILDENGLKATPGAIPAPNSGLFVENKKNIGSQMGQTNKKTLKKTKKTEDLNVTTRSCSEMDF